MSEQPEPIAAPADDPSAGVPAQDAVAEVTPVQDAVAGATPVQDAVADSVAAQDDDTSAAARGEEVPEVAVPVQVEELSTVGDLAGLEAPADGAHERQTDPAAEPRAHAVPAGLPRPPMPMPPRRPPATPVLERAAPLAAQDEPPDPAELAASAAVRAALVTEAESLRDSTDWTGTSGRLRELQQAWKDAPPLPRDLATPLWKRFRAACDVFFAARTETTAEQTAAQVAARDAKRALVARARELAGSQPTRAGTEEFKALQTQWKSAGTAPRGAEAQLWGAFRGAADRYFAAIGEQRASREVTQAEARTAKEQLLTEAGALRSSRDTEAVEATFADLLERWKAAGHAGRKDDDELWRRFSSTRRSVTEGARRPAAARPARGQGPARAPGGGQGRPDAARTNLRRAEDEHAWAREDHDRLVDAVSRSRTQLESFSVTDGNRGLVEQFAAQLESLSAELSAAEREVELTRAELQKARDEAPERPAGEREQRRRAVDPARDPSYGLRSRRTMDVRTTPSRGPADSGSARAPRGR